jgi:hypothetical protein
MMTVMLLLMMVSSVTSVSEMLFGENSLKHGSAHKPTLHFECFAMVSLHFTEYMGHWTAFPSFAEC